MNRRILAYWSAVIGLFGLIFLIMGWVVLFAPADGTPRGLILILQLPLLLLPMRGILHGKPYTHAWATFVALLYFIIGVDNAATSGREIYGGLQVLFSTMMFMGGMIFTRDESRRLKALSDPEED
jgi:uncharacterized membrane protein